MAEVTIDPVGGWRVDLDGDRTRAWRIAPGGRVEWADVDHVEAALIVQRAAQVARRLRPGFETVTGGLLPGWTFHVHPKTWYRIAKLDMWPVPSITVSSRVLFGVDVIESPDLRAGNILHGEPAELSLRFQA